MPSRVIHDIIGAFLRTSQYCDIRYSIEELPVGVSIDRILGNEPIEAPNRVTETKILRRQILMREIEDLPVSVYEELMGFLEIWHTSNVPVTFGSYRDVRLTHVEKVMSPYSFGFDFRLEFQVSGDMPLTHMREETRINYNLGRTTGGYEPVYEPVKKKEEPKVQEHFDKDLFEV